GGDLADALQRSVYGLAAGRCDLDGAVVLDVDLGAALLDDRADDRPARADDLADLVGRNMDRLDAWCMLAELGPRLAERLGHLAEDVQASLARLIERDAHDLLGDAGDLDVHLQRGDTFGRSGDLEIHV